MNFLDNNTQQLKPEIKQVFKTEPFLNLYLFDHMGEYNIPYTATILSGFLLPNSLAQPIQEAFDNFKPGKADLFITNNPEDPDSIGDIDMQTISYKQFSSADSLLSFIYYWASYIDYIFKNPGGDDDTFDYIPNHIYLFHNLIWDTLGKSYIKDHYNHLYKINPDYPEFFPWTF